jgi:F-type H+-transporting ATPase subunit alpha
MKAEEQVCSLFAGVRGFLDKVETSELSKFESLYLAHIRSKFPHILDSIKKNGKILPEIDAELRTLIVDFVPNAGLKMKGSAQ